MRAGNTGHFRTLAAGCICITAAGLTARAQAPRSLNDLTGPWQLLVDDYPVESKTGLARVYHPFTKYAANPVLVASKTWEGNHI